ncbi:hypothetical protein ZIOFF_064473 [Zingiber officinale]|uniref:Reverse transcriptase Ty1/copia-type domain-containing protein n=1 Tax=Zingiber officinale TaxID=94328 RepID=A0A8J5EW49_ZINOF|nr:hypothetical protein ZIOFF_064473 [Zingiber officinale]
MRSAEFSDHVCCLHKALYDLKQATSTWYLELRAFLASLGFIASRTDTSLFVYSRDDTVIYFLLYVDDLIITGSDVSSVDVIVCKLHAKLSIKDLGTLSLFYVDLLEEVASEEVDLTGFGPLPSPLIYKTRDTSMDDIDKYDKVELSVLLCDDNFIRKINKEWRDVDQATDVLSMSQHIPELDLSILSLGDVVMSLEIATKQAKERIWRFLTDLVRALLLSKLRLRLHFFVVALGLDLGFGEDMEKKHGFLSALRGEMARGLSPARSRSRSVSPQRNHSPVVADLLLPKRWKRQKARGFPEELLVPASGILAPLEEGPESGGGDPGKEGWGQWVKDRFHRAPSVSAGACRGTDLRLLLGVLGAPLAPVHVSPANPLLHLSIKDTPIVSILLSYFSFFWPLMPAFPLQALPFTWLVEYIINSQFLIEFERLNECSNQG